MIITMKMFKRVVEKHFLCDKLREFYDFKGLVFLVLCVINLKV